MQFLTAIPYVREYLICFLLARLSPISPHQRHRQNKVMDLLHRTTGSLCQGGVIQYKYTVCSLYSVKTLFFRPGCTFFGKWHKFTDAFNYNCIFFKSFLWERVVKLYFDPISSFGAKPTIKIWSGPSY